MKKYIKIIYWVIWLGLIYFGFSTVFSHYTLVLNLLQRVSGILLFAMLFIQIVLEKKINPLIYLLAIIHPLFLFIFNYKIFHTIDPFYIYTQACFLCPKPVELIYSFGRLAFWFLTLAFFWKKLEKLNYIVFFLVAIHSYMVGSDFKIFPLNYFFFISLATVLLRAVLDLKARFLRPRV